MAVEVLANPVERANHVLSAGDLARRRNDFRSGHLPDERRIHHAATAELLPQQPLDSPENRGKRGQVGRMHGSDGREEKCVNRRKRLARSHDRLRGGFQLVQIRVLEGGLDHRHLDGLNARIGVRLSRCDFDVAQRELSQSRADQRNRAEGAQGRARIDQSGDGIDAHGRIVVVLRVQPRMDVLPSLLEQRAQQCESLGESHESVCMDQGADQVRDRAQVSAAGKHCERLGLEISPVRIFRGNDRASDFLLRLALGRTLHFAERRIVFEVLTARRFRRNFSGESGHVEDAHVRVPPALELTVARPNPGSRRT